ncbi:MAG: hypothetical protein ACO1OB_30060 [Archangium sp.]
MKTLVVLSLLLLSSSCVTRTEAATAGCQRKDDECIGTCTNSGGGPLQSCRKVYRPGGDFECRCMGSGDCFLTAPKQCNPSANCSIVPGDCCKVRSDGDCACSGCSTK